MNRKILTPKRLLLLFVVINLVVGIFTVSDYGLGIDESQIIDRSEVALRRYAFDDSIDPREDLQSLGINQYYGTVLTMIFLLIEKIFRPLLGTSRHVIFHYTFFVSFQIGVVLVYYLTRRWVKDWWALAAAVLFGTQPLFYGHAFINPKDIPGMVIFLGTVLAGFWLADRLEEYKPPVEKYGQKLTGLMWEDWLSLKEGTRRKLRTLFLAFGGLISFWALRVHLWLPAGLLRVLYNVNPEGLLGGLAGQLMPNIGVNPVEDYIARVHAVLAPVFTDMVLGLSVIVFIVCTFIYRRTLMDLRQEISITYFTKSTRMHWRGWGAVALAGAVWGVAIATRASNIAAGLMVGLYVLLRLREKAILPLIGYVLAAVGACFAGWPYLWYFGVQGFIEGMQAFANYPYVAGHIWFRGSIPHADIPRTFLLQVMGLQFTEPMVILSLAGLGLAVVLAVRKKLPRVDVFILISWFFLPILFSILTRPTHYNNFRQFFFITTPLFVFAGLAFEKGAELLKNKIVLAVVLLLVFLPGLVGMVRLYPYQYVYYNQAAGGPEGAYRYYEMDYWVISYKEAVEYINANVPENAQILVVNGGDVPEQYARPDLTFIPLKSEISDEELAQYDYVLMSTNHRVTQLENVYALDTAYEVKAGGAVLAYVKVISP